MKKSIAVLIVFSIFLFHGCIPSVSQQTRETMGHSISVVTESVSRPGSYASSIGWKEKTYKLDNGNWVYVEPDRPGCFLHWEVNSQGIIVGYKLEGNRCY
ncbi:MAG: hypothetical protein EHM12_07895 [Dehalococcoidia bacterium]|nr:MAG: hypothetical protein EHM12_07895 [Dehalococcoidia bacterium]